MVISNKKIKYLEKEQAISKEKWVDGIYNEMTLKEKIGQLFMVDAYSNKSKEHTGAIEKLIKDNHLGGLCFFDGNPVSQSLLTNKYQSIAKVPLLIGIDAEWGLSMRLDNTFRYPNNMTLGAICDNNIIKRIGQQIGKHSKRIGIHVNFAPVVDVNTNPKNPIIGVRSYGEGKINVAEKATAFTEGIQSENVLACAKHFPGHGETDQDSHKTLPTVFFDAERIDSVELYPFKQLFTSNVASVMVGHLNMPNIQETEGLPTSLSPFIVTKLLKEKLNFKGLIFTDALNMKGVSNYKEPGINDLIAFEAGNDVLLFSEDAPKGMSLIEEAYTSGRITKARLSHSVRKILGAKYDVYLCKYEPIEISNITKDINTSYDKALCIEAIGNAITLVKDTNAVLATVNKNKKTAYVKIGKGSNKTFLSALKKHIEVDDLTGHSLKALLEKLKSYDIVIIGYHRFNTRRTKPIIKEDILMIHEIAKRNTVVLDVFANQYSLADLSFKNIETLVVSYENTKIAQDISAEILLGMREAIGKLPATINNDYKVNHHGI